MDFNFDAKLIDLIENVKNASGYRYDARDNKGNELHALKIIQVREQEYLGIYHSDINGRFIVKLAISNDLLNWRFIVDLDKHASQPYIQEINGKFIVAYEKDFSIFKWIRFRYYDNFENLVSNKYSKQFDAPRKLSVFSEGTPNIYNATLLNGIDLSKIEIGFHYLKKPYVDRVGKGILTNFSIWRASVEKEYNKKLESNRNESIGGREYFIFNGKSYRLQEKQLVKRDFASWRTFLYFYDRDEFRPLHIRTHNQSTAFANPKLSFVTLPNDKKGVVVTLFIPREGSGENESGELLYYKEIE